MTPFALALVLVAKSIPGPHIAPQRPQAPSQVRVAFRASADSFSAATREYERLWSQEGARMIGELERQTGLRFDRAPYADTAIRAIVYEGVSNSGYRDAPMQLRASYTIDTKRAALAHELGHRLLSDLFRKDEEEHDYLFLWLYDAWSALYGKEFADAQVTIERARAQRYEAAWSRALALSPEERAARWRAIRDERLSRR